ncbi:hypothetical protein PH203_49300 [Streptomyces sp. S.PB5]|nr:hypothetical protein [Streptomyces sp. S.PB5]MDN3029720.1 hypothetical protein [Streptomyces sp. S.PB5]
MRWGRQLDLHAIRSDAFAQSTVTDSAVAARVAKYVAESVGDADGVDHRITVAENIRLVLQSGFVVYPAGSLAFRRR